MYIILALVYISVLDKFIPHMTVETHVTYLEGKPVPNRPILCQVQPGVDNIITNIDHRNDPQEHRIAA